MAFSTTGKVWLAVYAVVSLVVVISEATFHHTVAFAGALAAMPALIGFLYATRPNRDRFYWLVIAALFFSWLGDWVGDLISPHVLVKIGFFFVGHVFYIMAFWPYHRRSVLRRPLALAAYVIIIAGLTIVIAVHSGRIAPAIIGYGILLGTMAVLSTGVNRVTGIGGAIFVSSDLTIALSAFVFPGRISQAELIIMSTYLLAQFLIVLGAIHAPNPKAAPHQVTGATPRPSRSNT